MAEAIISRKSAKSLILHDVLLNIIWIIGLLALTSPEIARNPPSGRKPKTPPASGRRNPDPPVYAGPHAPLRGWRLTDGGPYVDPPVGACVKPPPCLKIFYEPTAHALLLPTRPQLLARLGAFLFSRDTPILRRGWILA